MTDARDKWTMFHFALANPKGTQQGDVPRLLEALAAAIRDLGEITVQDITFHEEITEDGPWVSMTVYYTRDESGA